MKHLDTMTRLLACSWIVLIFNYCNFTEEKKQEFAKDTVLSPIATTLTDTPISKKPVFSDKYDSLEKVYVDTTTLAGKRQRLFNQFLIENGLVSPEFDTVFDINYDRYEDYIIGYYGQSGTGIKHSVKIYVYIPQTKQYLLEHRLSDLPNPTFYIKQKKITGFYIGNGGGSGRKLEWVKNKWTITKVFMVNNEGRTTKWTISYPGSRKNEIIIGPFQMIPPENILETDINWK